MSFADEAAASLQSVIDELQDARAASHAAKSQVEEGLTHAAAAGGAALVAAFDALRDTIEKLSHQISSTVDSAEDALAQAKAVSSGS